MEHLNMQTKNKADENFAKLAELFPNCVTESINENGELVRAIDKDILMQEISCKVVEGKEERYQFTWPDKKKSIVTANAPINKTLRPCKEESVGKDGTPGGFDSENLYIEGDNLEVLKLLQETYLGKIKMIYIDPPYNTGNDFVYKDNFTQTTDEYMQNSGQFDEDGNRLEKNLESNGRFHTDWLNMIYPRLKLARDLLTEDGVIFISIDDNEVENLKKVCSEIFGIENFVGLLSVENNPKGRKNSDFISVSSEYCMIFAKNIKVSYFVENVPKKSSDMDLDENGRYVHNSGKRVLVGENNFNKIVSSASSDKNYSVYYRKTDSSLKIEKEVYGESNQSLLENGYTKYYSHYKGRLVENTYSEERFRQLFKEKALLFSSDKIYEKNFNDTIRIKSQLVNREYEAIVKGKKKNYSMELTTTGAGTYLKNLFELEDLPFSAPKNTGFLKLLISLFDEKDLYLVDFFSGSASTADAVMQLNAEDNGNRKFIMIQLPENLDESLKHADATAKKTIQSAINFLNTINKPHILTEIGKERIRRAGKKIKEENPLTTSNLDIGFRVLKCDSSNMKDVYYHPDALTQEMFKNITTNIKEDRTPQDLLFQVMLELGVPLSSKIEKIIIEGKTIFNVQDGFLLACFEQNVTDSVITQIAKQKPQYFVMRDSSMQDDSVATNFEQLFKTYSPETVRKVL